MSGARSHVVVRGRGAVPAGTIWALGRTYAEHAREMHATTDPVVFVKPETALLPGGGEVAWPAGSCEVHHEVELVARLAHVGGGRGLDAGAGLAAIDALAVGLDLTARDLQRAAKRSGGPWTRAKGFPGSAPVSEFVPLTDLSVPLAEIDLAAFVDGTLRQRDVAGSMLRGPGEIVALLSRWFALRDGDLVFTGTPSGVGPVEPGATVRAVSEALGVSVSARLGRRPAA